MTNITTATKKIFRPVTIAGAAIILSTGAAFAGCYHATGYFAPDMMNCQQVGTTNMGMPIWRCCE